MLNILCTKLLPIFYPVSMQHSSYKHAFRIRVENSVNPGLKVIKPEYSLRLKINPIIGCLWTHVHKQPIIALYFDSKNELKFYNLKA